MKAPCRLIFQQTVDSVPAARLTGRSPPGADRLVSDAPRTILPSGSATQRVRENPRFSAQPQQSISNVIVIF